AAEREQCIASPGFVGLIEQLDRPPQVLSRLLVGKQVRGAPTREECVAPGGVAPSDRSRLEEMASELGGIDLYVRGQSLEPQCHPVVQPHATVATQAAIQDLAHQRVGE